MTPRMVEQFLSRHGRRRREFLALPHVKLVMALAASSVPMTSVWLEALIFWSASQFPYLHLLQDKSSLCWAKFQYLEREIGSMSSSLEADWVSGQIEPVLSGRILDRIGLCSRLCVGF